MTTHSTSENASPVHYDFSLLTAEDLFLFNEGSHYRVYDKLGAHLVESQGTAGAVFSLWAPNARRVNVIGSFNNWNPTSHQLQPRGSSGIWEGFIPGVQKGALYKFRIDQPARLSRRKSRPDRPSCRKTAAHRFRCLGSRLRLARPGLSPQPRRRQHRPLAHLHLRGSPRLLDARSRRAQSPAQLP